MRAKYEGWCGHCGLRIREGDRIARIEPVGLIKRFRIWEPTLADVRANRTHYEKAVTTSYAHADCKELME